VLVFVYNRHFLETSTALTIYLTYDWLIIEPDGLPVKMAVFSKPVSVDYTCYELGHTWTPSCTMASLSVALDVFREAVKIYGSLYLVCVHAVLLHV